MTVLESVVGELALPACVPVALTILTLALARLEAEVLAPGPGPAARPGPATAPHGSSPLRDAPGEPADLEPALVPDVAEQLDEQRA